MKSQKSILPEALVSGLGFRRIGGGGGDLEGWKAHSGDAEPRLRTVSIRGNIPTHCHYSQLQTKGSGLRVVLSRERGTNSIKTHLRPSRRYKKP